MPIRQKAHSQGKCTVLKGIDVELRPDNVDGYLSYVIIFDDPIRLSFEFELNKTKVISLQLIQAPKMNH